MKRSLAKDIPRDGRVRGVRVHPFRNLVAAATLTLAALGPMSGNARSLAEDVHAGIYGLEQLVILFPGDRTTVFDNDGSIDVHVLALTRQRFPGSRIELLLDGRPVMPREGERFVLRNLKRGKHRLRARLVTKSGSVIVDSRPVRFYKWHPVRPALQASQGQEEKPMP